MIVIPIEFIIALFIGGIGLCLLIIVHIVNWANKENKEDEMKAKFNFNDKHCAKCGKLYTPRSGVQKYCDKCRNAKSKSNNIYWQDKICVICQKRFTPTGGAQRYCAECANFKAKSDNAKSHRVYYNENMKQKKEDVQNTVVQLVAMNIKKLRIHDLILLILGILNVATLILAIVK